MTQTRSYHQNCTLARALDLVGERWMMLVVRELSRGPKRFGELSEALGGIGASMLASRVKRLQDAGVAAHEGGRYALTERGERLARALGELALWGLELEDVVRPGDATRAAWLAMNMQARLRRDGLDDAPAGTYAFAIDEEPFWLHVGPRDATLLDGTPPFPPDVSVTTTMPGFYALATGASIADAGVAVEGDRELLEALLSRTAIAPLMA